MMGPNLALYSGSTHLQLFESQYFLFIILSFKNFSAYVTAHNNGRIFRRAYSVTQGPRGLDSVRIA